MTFSLLHLHFISCARTLVNHSRRCLRKAVLKEQEKKVRERESNMAYQDYEVLERKPM